MTLASSPWGSVIIPIKDERDNLSPLTEQLLKALTSVPLSRTAAFEILYVDDGSTDGSSALLDILAANYKQVNILHFDRNYGQHFRIRCRLSSRQRRTSDHNGRRSPAGPG